MSSCSPLASLEFAAQPTLKSGAQDATGHSTTFGGRGDLDDLRTDTVADEITEEQRIAEGGNKLDVEV